ncbi:MAG: hypothetical protein FK733_03805 [Asgard group archaeon]|nr:hypothetical protein [Asgard group archaeon]
MSWNELLIKYIDFVSNLDDIRILSNLSYQIFDKYPQNIPLHIYEPIDYDLSFARDIVKLQYTDESKTPSREIKDPKKFKPKSKLSSMFLESSMAKAIQIRIQSEDVDEAKVFELKSIFKKIILEQEFLSYYSLFEAYLNSILTIIFKKYPKKLSPKDLPKDEKRNIKWDDILHYDNYDDLIEFMIEKYVYSFGYKSLYKRLNHLQNSKNFNLQINIVQNDEQLLNEIEELRNCFIHSGGRVTIKALPKLRQPNINVGDEIILTPKANIEIYNFFKQKSNLLFKQTAEKYYKKEFDEAYKKDIWIKFITNNVFTF